MCELLIILQHISVTNIILSNNVYDISIVRLLLALLNFESFIHGHFLSFFFFKKIFFDIFFLFLFNMFVLFGLVCLLL